MSDMDWKKVYAYLVVDEQGELRLRKRRPFADDLRVGEHAFRLVIEVPVRVTPVIVGDVQIVLPMPGDELPAVTGVELVEP